MLVMCYVRVSSQEQAREGYSIQEQTERMKKYCEAMGWKIYNVYTDPGFSGAKMDRPALSQMIRDIKDKRADKVLVYKLDRLSRSQLDTLYLIEKVFLANDVDFVSMSENFDTATPFGRAMIGILAVFAQLEREQIRERMMMGKEARAKEGKFKGSWNVPIGYDYIPEKGLIVNEFEKAQVLTVFEMFFDGVPIKRMIKLLEEKGYKHKFGAWSDRTIRNVLRSKTYLGYIVYRGEWMPGNQEPIISEEMHQKAVRMLDDRKRDYEKNRRPGKAQSYLGGLLICKQCGAKYSKKTSSKNKDGSQRFYYLCNSRARTSPTLVKNSDCRNKGWRMEELDNIIFDQIRQLAIDPRYFELAIETQKENRSDVLRAEIDKLDIQLEKLVDLYLVDSLPLAAMKEKIGAIQEQKNKLNAEIVSIERENQTALTKQEAIHKIQSFGDVLDTGDFSKIRELLTSLIDYIALDDDSIEIHWSFT